jgi:two-component sensor histidine kinase
MGDAMTEARSGAAEGVCDQCAPLQEAHHRVANHLAMIASYTRLAAAEVGSGEEPAPPDRFDSFVAGLLAQLDAAAGVHRVLSTAADAGETDAAAFLETVCRPLSELVSPAAEIEQAFEASGPLTATDAALVAQFVAEAVTNAAKYAHPEGRIAHITVASRREADGGLSILVADDGPGPSGKPAESGLGTRLLQSIADRLHADLERRPGPEGFEVRLTLPGG